MSSATLHTVRVTVDCPACTGRTSFTVKSMDADFTVFCERCGQPIGVKVVALEIEVHGHTGSVSGKVGAA